tara:strand:- start:247632 stop:248069 length:438 start_codon:yes stop_codon:yes gene_type:complete
MKFRIKTNRDVSINLTPLIDVVFLLLIFFMVSTTFKNESQLTVDLPHASHNGTEAVGKPIYIAIGSDGNYEVNGQQYIADNLTLLHQALLEIKEPAETQIFIAGDKNAPHQSLVTLLEMSAEVGISKIRILAQNKQSHLYQTAMK